MAEYRVVQYGMEVAGVQAPEDLSALSMALHYAGQYLEDGPVRIERKRKGGWSLVAEQSPHADT